MTADKQSSLDLGPSDITRRANKVSKKASKARRKVRLPMLPMADGGFEPVSGVPKTRGQCPTSGICKHVRCRHHLLLEDAAHRSGRPGLGSVPRDSRGLTISAPGEAGCERPGTTLRPGWLRVRGVLVEQEINVWIHMDIDGLSVNESRHGTFDYWLKHLRVGEPVHVIDNDLASPLYGQAIAHAWLTPERDLKFDRYPDRMFVMLRRVRPVMSCALDLIDRHGKLTNEQTGDALARHRTLVAREVRKAMRKAITNAEALGMSQDDLLRGLREMGAQ
jgi:hypothetical protein